MQGIESLGYEVVPVPIHEQMGFPDSGIAKFKKAADMMADFGRNGDTYIVHAAEGETVLPMEVLDKNPKLKKMIFKQMEDMGLDPQRYVVGSDLNSINPVTGQPEFFFALIAKTVKKAVKAVVKVVKKIAPIVLPFVAPFVLPTMPAALAAGLGSTAGNLIAGKSLKDSLLEGLKTGAITGVGQVLTGGSALGSTVDPKNTQGLQSLGKMFTPDNPFTAGKFNAIRQVEDAVKFGSERVSSRGFGKQTLPPQTIKEQRTFGQDLRSALTPGDDYGVGDFYSEYLSPSRPSISADVNQAGIDAVNAFQARNPNATEAMLTRVFDTAVAQAKPSLLQQYGPLAATTLGGAAASDALLGTNLITPPKQEKINTDEIFGAARRRIEEDPDRYTLSSGFYEGNPFYDPVLIGDTTSTRPDFIPAFDPLAGTQFETYGQVANQPASNQGIATLPDGPQGQYGINTGFAQNLFSQPSMGVMGNPFLQAYDPLKAKSGGEIVGPGTPTSDSIPAMLSDGEFVMNARAVRGAGGGDRKQGAKRMYEMMSQFERSA
mgnify:FL=1